MRVAEAIVEKQAHLSNECDADFSLSLPHHTAVAHGPERIKAQFKRGREDLRRWYAKTGPFGR